MGCSPAHAYDWEGHLVSVQGFGFIPPCLHLEIEKRFMVRGHPLNYLITLLSFWKELTIVLYLFQHILELLNIDKSNLTLAQLDRMKVTYDRIGL